MVAHIRGAVEAVGPTAEAPTACTVIASAAPPHEHEDEVPAPAAAAVVDGAPQPEHPEQPEQQAVHDAAVAVGLSTVIGRRNVLLLVVGDVSRILSGLSLQAMFTAHNKRTAGMITDYSIVGTGKKPLITSAIYKSILTAPHEAKFTKQGELIFLKWFA